MIYNIYEIEIYLKKNFKMKILVIEDNPILRDNLSFLLKKHNFLAETANNGQDALDKIAVCDYDALILDVNMPIMNGKQFLKQLRLSGKNTPVIALTSNAMLEDKIEMFELWVDDYLTKPFEIQELVMRIKTITKRWEIKQDSKKEIWEITINFSTSKILLKGEIVTFPHKQYMIIEFLAKNIWYPQSKVKIMEYVWGESEENLEFDSTTLESHIYAIRKKLGKTFIKTIKSIWYIIE